MEYIIFAIGILIVFVYLNIDKFKRIKRRRIIKKMKVNDNINELIEEFKRKIKDNSVLKNIQNQIRIIIIAKNLLYLILTTVLVLSPFIYFFYKIEFKEEILSVDQIYRMLIIYVILIFTYIIVWVYIEFKKYQKYKKNKELLKEYIYNDFLKGIKSDIKWYDNQKTIVSEKTFKMWDTYINWTEAYKRASFNKIQFDEEKNENVLLSMFSSSNKVSFEDYISGIYKKKYIISMSDFKEYMISGNIGRKTRYLQSEGIFCTIKIDKNIINDIRITNDKRHAFFMEKQYMITTMPEEFYKNFIILAKDGYKISEKISKKSIEMIEEFYKNSKIKFDISIKNDEIFFRFKTIDSMELNSWINIVDDLMLKEYSNIIMFITGLSEEINDNWKRRRKI